MVHPYKGGVKEVIRGEGEARYTFRPLWPKWFRGIIPSLLAAHS